ncbi:MAG: GIY-YIG nuclease family protein, partial [Bacteroidetes bacterium]|nr:GIY-YIG nuclease family protein [Bacteroidota bacterium]
MFYVYVLYSFPFDKIYIGFTSDLEARLKSHNELATKGWTIKFRPWKIVFQESFTTKAGALISQSYTVKQPGYVYMYVSNEQAYQTDVFIDDVTTTFTPSPVVQQEDFYPGGATFNSYSRENSVPNNYLYQHKEYQSDLSLNLYDFHWRQYDPWAVLTTTQDPHADKYYSVSPYSWAGGNPLKYIDPSGKDIV